MEGNQTNESRPVAVKEMDALSFVSTVFCAGLCQTVREIHPETAGPINEAISAIAAGEKTPLNEPLYQRKELSEVQGIRKMVAKTCQNVNSSLSRHPVLGEVFNFRSFLLPPEIPPDILRCLAADPLFLNSILGDINERISQGLEYRGNVVSKTFTGIVLKMFKEIPANLQQEIHQVIDIRDFKGLTGLLRSVAGGKFVVVGDLPSSSFKESEKTQVTVTGRGGDFLFSQSREGKFEVREEVGIMGFEELKDARVRVRGNAKLGFGGGGCQNCLFVVDGEVDPSQFALGAKDCVFLVGRLNKDAVSKLQAGSLILIEKDEGGNPCLIFCGEGEVKQEIKNSKDKIKLRRKAVVERQDEVIPVTPEQFLAAKKIVLHAYESSGRVEVHKIISQVRETLPLSEPEQEPIPEKGAGERLEEWQKEVIKRANSIKRLRRLQAYFDDMPYSGSERILAKRFTEEQTRLFSQICKNSFEVDTGENRLHCQTLNGFNEGLEHVFLASITSLPDNLTIHGYANLNFLNGLRQLPRGLICEDNLNIAYCSNIEVLPGDLVVKGGTIFSSNRLVHQLSESTKAKYRWVIICD